MALSDKIKAAGMIITQLGLIAYFAVMVLSLQYDFTFDKLNADNLYFYAFCAGSGFISIGIALSSRNPKTAYLFKGSAPFWGSMLILWGFRPVIDSVLFLYYLSIIIGSGILCITLYFIYRHK